MKTIMKKTYQSPAIEELYVESGELMENSLPKLEDEVSSNEVLSRELFNDALFDED